MARPDPVTLSVTTLALTSGISAFTQFMPPITEIRKKSLADAEFAADVRVAEVAAASVCIGIGGVASSLSESSTPVWVSVFVAAGLIGLYEYVLRSPGAQSVLTQEGAIS